MTVEFESEGYWYIEFDILLPHFPVIQIEREKLGTDCILIDSVFQKLQGNVKNQYLLVTLFRFKFAPYLYRTRTRR